MIKNRQTVHVEDQEGEGTYFHLVLESALGSFAFSYQCLMHEPTRTVFLSPAKWDQWKRCKPGREQENFLSKHVTIYQVGKLPAHYEEKFTTILDLFQAEKEAAADNGE